MRPSLWTKRSAKSYTGEWIHNQQSCTCLL